MVTKIKCRVIKISVCYVPKSLMNGSKGEEELPQEKFLYNLPEHQVVGMP